MTKKIYFRLVTIICALFLIVCFLPINSVKADDGGVEIVVYSCEDYIDEELLDEFNEEYAGQYTVNYLTKATPEDMYTELKNAPTKTHLVCPSEYMIMKMMSEDLIKPYATPNNMKEHNSPYINRVFQSLKVNVGGKEVPILSEDKESTYAVGYMWGTMGFVYNMGKFSEEDLKNWETLLTNPDCAGKSTIKDSIRDTYIMAVGAVYKDELLALDKTAEDYNEQLTKIFNRTDDETVAKVEEYLQQLRVNLYGFEVDSGKDDILQEKITVNFAWSGDAVYAMDEGDGVGVELGYIVPEEGSNVWFDGFVMSKECKGEYEKGAIAFLDFLSRPENAIRNMEYTGYTSVVGNDEVYEWLIEYYELDTQESYDALSQEEQEELTKVDLSYFFNDTPTGDYVVYSSEMGRQLYAQYADYPTISRCAVMDNFSEEDLQKIGDMWNRVKLTTLSTLAIILIVVALILVCLFVVAYKNKDKILALKIFNREAKAKKSKYQIVSIKEVDYINKDK